MRIIDEISHPKMRISIFSMNAKYLLKFEVGPLEQTYKWSELDFTSLEDFKLKVQNSGILQQAEKRFEEMIKDLSLVISD